MSTPLIYPPLQDGLQKTLDASLLTGVTASATLNNVTGIQNLKGLMVIDRVDANNNLTPNKREYITFAGTSGSTVITLVRGLAGSTDQDHAVGAIVEFVNDIVQQQAILDGLSLTVTTAGALNSATGAEVNTGTDPNKIVTPKAIADSYLGGATSNIQTQITNLNSGWIPAGTFTYASADAPTYVITVASGAASIYNVGDRIKLTDSTVKYFIVTAVADTSLTVYGGTDYTLSGGAITLPYYSHQKVPLGFPLNPLKWSIVVTDTNGVTRTTPSTNTWYELDTVGNGSGTKTNTITAPIGIWKEYYKVSGFSFSASTATNQLWVTMSAANNSETNSNMRGYIRIDWAGAAASHQMYQVITAEDFIVCASKTVLYLLANTRDAVYTIGFGGDIAPTLMRLTCAYL